MSWLERWLGRSAEPDCIWCGEAVEGRLIEELLVEDERGEQASSHNI